MPFVESSENSGIRLGSLRIPLPAVVGAGLLIIVCMVIVAVGLFPSESSAFIAPSDTAEEQQSDEESVDAEDTSASEGDTTDNAAVQESQSSPGEVMVHVAGAVASPGVYAVSEGARVQDAVDAAGGFASDAASDAVNLARTLQDGEQILIPTEEQVESGDYASTLSSTDTSSSTGTDGQSTSSLVNINTAGIEELDTLPGIGPVTAQAIVDERESNGAFTSTEDIQRVSGIGEKKFEKLKDLICV